MKIKNQFIVCIAAFSIVLVFIAGSVAATQLQVVQIAAQEEIVGNIERGASSLNRVSIDYFLYQEDLQLSKWESALISLSSDLSSLKLDSPQQQALAKEVAEDLQRLNALFGEVISYLQNAPRNVSVRIDPAFQIRWSGMAIQSHELASDASQLSNSLNEQAHQVNNMNTLLIISLVCTFGALLVTIYLLVFRRTLKSVAGLQKGINTIGSGNLDYKIEIDGQNEITELSHAFNQMTTNLKTVTSSKTELETEIAGRKQAETALRESEQRWATTLASIGDAVIATDLSGKVTFMNGVAEELTGWTLSEALLKPVEEIFNIVNEQTRDEVENPVTEVLEKGLIVGLANHTVLIRKNGTEVAIDDSGAPIRDQNGKTTGVVLIFRDITERKKAEEAIKQSEQFYHTVFDNSQDGFQLIEIIYDENGKPYDHKFLKVNQAYEKIIGVSAEDITDKTARSISPNAEPYWFEVPERVVKTGKTEHVELYNKDINKTLDCYYFPYTRNVVGTLFRDITERKNLEMQLKDSERLAAIGATAGMVGHDIRNPLQSIISDLYLAKSDLASLPESEEKQSINENLDEIGKSVEYVNKIVQDLQDFARPVRPVAKATDLGEAIEDQLSRIRIPQNVKVSRRIEEDAKTVVADPDILKRILANLIMNAVQAMPDGGRLTIYAYRAADGVAVDVKDTGVGIPEVAKCKLFTPLFTTKSKGQGFGLAVVKRLTESLNGTVAFDSKEGKGTTFTIKLPANKANSQ